MTSPETTPQVYRFPGFDDCDRVKLAWSWTDPKTGKRRHRTSYMKSAEGRQLADDAQGACARREYGVRHVWGLRMTETTAWKFYHEGVYGPAEEHELREFGEQLGVFSCEKGMASVVMEQMWGEIDRLRERIAELEPRPKNYASCTVSSTDD